MTEELKGKLTKIIRNIQLGGDGTGFLFISRQDDDGIEDVYRISILNSIGFWWVRIYDEENISSSCTKWEDIKELNFYPISEEMIRPTVKIETGDTIYTIKGKKNEDTEEFFNTIIQMKEKALLEQQEG